MYCVWSYTEKYCLMALAVPSFSIFLFLVFRFDFTSSYSMNSMKPEQSESSTTKLAETPAEDTTTNTTLLEEPQKKREKKDKMKDLIQPRLRKITTVSSSLGLIVQSTEKYFTVWILNTYKFIDIGHSEISTKFKLGSWISVGLFPTGELASFLPEPFVVTPHQTKIVDGRIMVFSTLGESFTVRDKNSQFGKVGLRASLAHLLTKKIKDNAGVWIKWLTAKEVEKTEDKCQWMIVEVDQNQTSDTEDFGDHEYRKCAEFIRNRVDKTKVCESRLSECPYKSTIRHFGLVTDIAEAKGQFCVWSPGISAENDHLARVPMDKESGLFGEYPPASGQWIQFDMWPREAEKYAMPNGGSRFSINEYMPISTPKGITVFHIGRSFRVILTCALVRSTEDPLIYELADFGLVMDRKSNLRSGAFMQLVLERVPLRTRKQYSINWKIVGSKFIESGKMAHMEKTQSLVTQLVPHYEAYECCTSMTIDRNHYIRLPSQSYIGHQKFSRRDGYGPSNGLMYDGLKKKFNNSSVDGMCLVEKVDMINYTAILWSFDSSVSYHVTFNVMNEVKFGTGDLIYVVLQQIQQKPDPKTGRAFRWAIQNYEKRDPTYKCSIVNNRVNIFEEMQFFGMCDSLNRPMLKGKHFPMIVDEQHILHSKVFHNFPNQKVFPLIINAFVARKKIQNSNYDPTKPNPTEVFNWVLVDSPSFGWQPYPTCFLPPHMPHNMIFQQNHNDAIKSLMAEENKNGQKP